MTQRDAGRRLSALELRREFDSAFSREPPGEPEAVEDLLTLTVASDRYALRGAEIRGIVLMPKLARVPSPLAELLGLAGIRGALVPVFDLGRLLGHAPASAPPRWVFLVGNEQPVGFGFDAFERQVRAPKSAVSRADTKAVVGDFSAEVLQLSGKAVPIISVPLVLSAIEKSRARAARAREDV